MAIEATENAPITPQLNENQQAAVHSASRTTAVIAGPGTGKTKTLVSRIEYLITEKGVSPKEITAVTFTRQAAQEMQSRLESTVGKKAVKGLTVGTFHSIALGLLPKKAIADRETRLSFMADVLAERGEKLSPAAALERLSLQKNGKSAALAKAIAEDYQQRLENANLRDLDDVLLEALGVDASQMPAFRYLLVDEFQDINAAQHQLVRHWCGETGNLFVIGDPDQSIYGFRGADADCFARLLADRPYTNVITLTQNYRSTAAVLECATALINHNPGENRQLAAQGAAGEPVRLMTASDAFSEAAWIAREINAMVGGADMLSAHNSGNQRDNLRAFSEMAVLCRTHRQLEQIETSLRQQGIPCVICGRERFWEDTTVQALLGVFRWLRHPEDAVSLNAALHTLWKCPDALIQQVQAASREIAAQSGDGIIDVDTLRARLAPFELLLPFVETAETLLPLMATQPPRKLIDQLAKATSCKGKAIEQLLDAAVFHKRMDAFLDALEVGEEADIRRRSGSEKPSGAISLMTLHGAKGLEFPVVFLAGINENDLPHCREGEESDVEEERRLFFVGITRAREELILSCGGAPSAFLSECPASVLRNHIPKKQPAIRMEQLSLL